MDEVDERGWCVGLWCVAAAEQWTEPGPRKRQQVARRLTTGQQVSGALGQHDRHIEQNAVPTR